MCEWKNELIHGPGRNIGSLEVLRGLCETFQSATTPLDGYYRLKQLVVLLFAHVWVGCG